MFRSRIRDAVLFSGVRAVVEFIGLLARQVLRSLEVVALPLLLVASLSLISVAAARAVAWSGMMPLLTVPKDRIAAENEAFITLSQVLGAGFVLTGLYFTARSFIMSRRGQFAERFGHAVEGMSDNELGRRLGSLSSLSAMATVEDRDARALVELLCGFIKTQTTAEDYTSSVTDGPRADIQAAVRILGDRGSKLSLFAEARIDLRKARLDGADFDRGDFRNALFQGASLKGSTFFRARLDGSVFTEATADGANFNQASLTKATFFRSKINSATFRRTRLVKANFTRAEASNCSFDGALIVSCVFASSTLEGSTFDAARLRRNEVHKVDLPALTGSRSVRRS